MKNSRETMIVTSWYFPPKLFFLVLCEFCTIWDILQFIHNIVNLKAELMHKHQLYSQDSQLYKSTQRV